MNRQIVAAGLALSLLAGSGYAATVPGDPEAGRLLVTNSCTTCHAAYATTAATDGAPPLSFLAKDNKANPRWIHGWLMDPHPPMPGIMLSRRQIDDVMAYLSTLPAE